MANEAATDLEALDMLVAKRAREIAAASPGAVSAYKKLYRLHEEQNSLEQSLLAEVNCEFPEISDTLDRLNRFG